VKTDVDGKVASTSRGWLHKASLRCRVSSTPNLCAGGPSDLPSTTLDHAATNGLGVRQADVEGGHLNGKLDVELYMAYPEDIMPKPEYNALRLLGSMYGLKQSGRTWWIEPGQVLEALGFKRT
jgi:hypothetical protein